MTSTTSKPEGGCLPVYLVFMCLDAAANPELRQYDREIT